MEKTATLNLRINPDIKKSAEEYGKLLNSSQSYINKEAPEDGEEEDNRGN